LEVTELGNQGSCIFNDAVVLRLKRALHGLNADVDANNMQSAAIRMVSRSIAKLLWWKQQIQQMK
jgi:hypothetical protein